MFKWDQLLNYMNKKLRKVLLNQLQFPNNKKKCLNLYQNYRRAT